LHEFDLDEKDAKAAMRAANRILWAEKKQVAQFQRKDADGEHENWEQARAWCCIRNAELVRRHMGAISGPV